MKCEACGEKLTFTPGKGYLHPDGNMHGKSDDHIARPVSESEHECGCSSGVGQRCTCKTIRRERMLNQIVWRERNQPEAR